LTNIKINNMRITGSQIWVNINGIDSCLELYETSVLLGHMQEKTIEIESREFNKRNDPISFKNHFMFVLNRLLDNANGNRWFGAKDKISIPYWLIDKINYYEDKIIVIIHNIMNEQIEDQY